MLVGYCYHNRRWFSGWITTSLNYRFIIYATALAEYQKSLCRLRYKSYRLLVVAGWLVMSLVAGWREGSPSLIWLLRRRPLLEAVGHCCRCRLLILVGLSCATVAMLATYAADRLKAIRHVNRLE